MRPGQATSRIRQAVGWLRQLGLVDEGGLMADGRTLLDRIWTLLGNRKAAR